MSKLSKLSLSKETVTLLNDTQNIEVVGGSLNPRVCDTETGGSGNACTDSAYCPTKRFCNPITIAPCYV